MENNKQQVINNIVVILKFLVICTVAVLVLSLVHSFTSVTVKNREMNSLASALKELFPEAVPGKQQVVEDKNYRAIKAYYVMKNKNKTAGYILSIRRHGYGGVLDILCSYKPDGEVKGVKLLHSNETPDWDEQAAAGSYMKKFTGKGGTGSKYAIPLTKAMLILQQYIPATQPETGEEQDILHVISHEFFGTVKPANTDSITGASITFAGIAGTVETGSAYVKNVLRTKP